MKLITITKEKQIEEAEETLKSLEQSKNNAAQRYSYYKTLYEERSILDEAFRLASLAANPKTINVESEIKDFTRNSAFEAELIDLALRGLALVPQGFSVSLHGLSVAGHLAPDTFGFSNGGMDFGSAIQAGAQAADGIANMLNQAAGLSNTVAQYARRKQEWELQMNLAFIDREQIQDQVNAQTLRKEIAECELEIHEKTIEQAKEIEDFLKGKFTNQELYQWMIGRVSILYFQTYKIALDMAMAAQSAYQYELNKDDSYIKFNYWDSLKKGLLAGESLMLGLNQLEKAYIERNVRRLEIEKDISLLQLKPEAFIDLINTGECQFELTELLFARDFPRHYCRTIQSVSISIPAVIGPYQTLRATLTQTGHKTLLKPKIKGVEYLLGISSDNEAPDYIRSDWRSNQQVAISRGDRDSGIFELSFNDGRYLPFEGTGVVSNWLLEMPKASNPIDFSTITDVIIHLRYTCQSDSGLKDAVKSLPEVKTYNGLHLFSLMQDFPAQWRSFKNEETQELELTLPNYAFPPNITEKRDLKIVKLFSVMSDGSLVEEVNFDAVPIDGSFKFTLSMPSGFDKEQTENLVILLEYTGTLNF